MHQNVKNFSRVGLVYLLEPHTSSIKMRTTEFYQDYVGSLVIDTVLDSTHYTLEYLEKRVLVDISHINRLKLIVLSIAVGTATPQMQLTLTTLRGTCSLFQLAPCMTIITIIASALPCQVGL